jgi:hypothetical protein
MVNEDPLFHQKRLVDVGDHQPASEAMLFSGGFSAMSALIAAMVASVHVSHIDIVQNRLAGIGVGCVITSRLRKGAERERGD